MSRRSKSGCGSENGSGEDLVCGGSEISVTAVSGSECVAGQSRQFGNDLPQQATSDLERGFFVGRERASGEEDGRNRRVFHAAGFEVVGQQADFFQLLRCGRYRFGGLGESLHSSGEMPGRGSLSRRTRRETVE